MDVIATRPHYQDHIDPVLAALGDLEAPGWVLVASGGDSARAARMGYRTVIRMEHGIGQSYGGSHPAYAGGVGQARVALFLVPNDHAARRWRARYQVPVAVVGSPFAETLPAPDPDAMEVAISFHWHSSVVPELRSSLPHYRPALAQLARAFPVVGHAHPRALPMVAEAFAGAGIRIDPDYRSVLRRARVFIADNTSALYEAALTRPVVVLDAPWYRRDEELGLRFWAAADVGVRVDHPDQLFDAVWRAIEDPAAVAARREEALGMVYAHRTGAAQRAADAIRSVVSRRGQDERGTRS